MVHLLDDVYNMLWVSAAYQEPLDYKVKVKLERLWIQTSTHDLDHFICQFEICFFKFQVIGWWYVKDESKVNVNQVTFFCVYQDVSVVPVLDL